MRCRLQKRFGDYIRNSRTARLIHEASMKSEIL